MSYPDHSMNIDEAVEMACEQPSLVDALSWIAVWESERAIQQARRFFETGIRTGSYDSGWDTCFKVCFERVVDRWHSRKAGDIVEAGKAERIADALYERAIEHDRVANIHLDADDLTSFYEKSARALECRRIAWLIRHNELE